MEDKELTDFIYKAVKKGRKKLDLSSKDLASLPPEIGMITTLTQLDLSGNRLTTLPAEIGLLTNLTHLHIRGNQLISLPSEIGQLSNLNQLIVSNNRLVSLPSEIGNLANLSQLIASGNRLSSLSNSIGLLTKLTQLTLSGNRLTNLPPEIGCLTMLTQLYLGRNRLKSLPPEIGKLTLLTNLDLSYNKLTMLLPEIRDLKKLRQLDLLRNPIDIPPEILKKKPQTIISYYFSDQKKDGDNGKKKNLLTRSIEFPPEYHQAGISILNYFGTVLRKKYPNIQAKIKIEQDGLKVSMIIDPGNGTPEIIERALDDYGLVVSGKIAPEEFTDDRLLMIELKGKLRSAYNEIETQKELLKYQHDQVISKDIQINRFISLMECAFHRPMNVNVSQVQGDKLHVGNKIKEETAMGDTITITAKGDVNFAKDQAIATINKTISDAKVSGGLEKNLKQLTDSVSEMLKTLPEDKAAELIKDLETLIAEASKDKPARRKKWYELSAEGLIEAAKAVGSIGQPVIEATRSVLELLEG